MAGLGRFTAAGHLTQDFGPGIPSEPDNIYAQRNAGGWLRAKLSSFAGSVKRDDFHLGIDIGCPTGTPALAPEAGIVRSHYIDPYGAKILLLEIQPGTLYQIGHLSKFVAEVGARVKRGQRIALTGNSGMSTAPHAHIEVRHHPTDTNWRRWYSSWFAYDPQRLREGGDLADVIWIKPL